LQCHRFENDGGVAGPELTGVGSKYSERDLLESIIEPSKVVSDQYQDHTVFLKDGEVFSGKLISESDKEVVLEIDRVAGTKEDFPRDNIEQLRPSQLSPMPTGLVNVLSLEEIFDLLAYLRTGVSTTR
jgi:putative heme-binding domain-containing protein